MEHPLDILRGLRPFEAALFVKLALPDSLIDQLASANQSAGKNRGLTTGSVSRTILRVACSVPDFSYVAIASKGSRSKTVCFAFRAADQIFAACGSAYGTKVTPGMVWESLQPFGHGHPETLERKFLQWAQESGAAELSSSIKVQATAAELEFLETVKSDDNRDHALRVFADWLEDRGDPRAEKIRQFAGPAR